ncbi:MAG: UDP-2,3-diacylglucosamine diphosphatase [Planctomycetota bacterium]|nr:UDP-2,3-diacylglucosamine diphosphatase [Planctomycetota bacterium]
MSTQHASDSAGPPAYDCLVISDLHLGSDVCQAKLLEEFLEWAVKNARMLVVNGDIFDDLNFKRLSRRHFACLKILRRNADRDDFTTVWVRGNHDGPADIVSHIVGVDVHDEYVYHNARVDLLILHGDQFDTFITQYRLLTALGCGIFFYIQKWMPHRAARWIRRISKRWQRNSQLIERRAIEYARSRGFRFVTCGHTHLPGVVDRDGVRYLNSGTWTEHPPCPFVAVRGEHVELLHWPLAAGESLEQGWLNLGAAATATATELPVRAGTLPAFG